MDPVIPPQPTTQPVTTPPVIPPAPSQPIQTPNTPKKKSKLGFIISLLIILLLLCVSGAAGYTIYKNLNSDKVPIETACTMEAMICPDGSSVGREGPNCEFTPCPTVAPSETDDWQAIKSELVGVTIKHPNNWSSEEKDEALNDFIELKDGGSGRTLTIFKNYIGGVAGFKEYKENSPVIIDGINSESLFYTEDSSTPETVSMFINLPLENDKYLIIASWNIDDTQAEDEIDQILSTFKFTE